MKEKLEIKNLDDLYEAVLCLETVEECRLFFKDLCTIPELKALSQRFQVAKMLTKDLGKIDWNKDAAAIERLIRGLNSWPSAYTAFHDKTLKIWDADVEEESSDAQPGTVVKVTPDALYVQTGKNLLKLNEVQIQGKKRMPVKAFLLGHKVEIGTLLGQDNENNR